MARPFARREKFLGVGTGSPQDVPCHENEPRELSPGETNRTSVPAGETNRTWVPASCAWCLRAAPACLRICELASVPAASGASPRNLIP
jgi:hypothetical protein